MSGTKKAKKLQEQRRLVMARLAASETASLMNRSIEMTLDRDKRRVYERISNLNDVDPSELDRDPFWATLVERSVDRMIKVMRDADLNVNFPAHKFFAASKTQEKYTTKFEHMRNTGAPMGDPRNEAEEKMFRYSEGIGVDLDAASPGEKAAALRAEDFGVLDGKNFTGAVRPKYCSMNFPALVDGMGAQWGRSHLVLADHLKPNMTFIHSDSFDVVGSPKVTLAAGQGMVANYHHMFRLLANMSERLLEAVIDAADGDIPSGLASADFRKKYGLGSTAYIEGHVHGEIYFSRDVRKIRICNAEATAPDIKKNIAKFAGKYSVETEFFD